MNNSGFIRATLSGRGIGMGVILEKLETLQESLEIKNQIGKGSTFLITLPNFAVKASSAA